MEEKNNIGSIFPKEITQEMQVSYLDYAMSVIVARALPDVRDGLKPVHRRILYTLHEMGLTSAAKFRKSAAIVGEVLGKYHPHGDIAVYDSLVRMAQKFAMRYPLVHGQGNFGSIDGDSPAAMRYTEAKMSKLAEEILTDIEKETVDFIPNYDGTRVEPQVLPAKLPNLLLNGTLGIAVGMATNIPPHNLAEVTGAIIHLIDNPEASLEELMDFVKGPDFPTGGEIYGLEGIKNAYATGKGSFIVRAKTLIEADKGKHRILVSSLPYQINKANLVAKIADLVKAKKIEGIADLRDESDRKEMVRIVIELKTTAHPKKVLNQLYEMTELQTAFHVNLLALVDGIEPRVLMLKTILEEYIKHRQNIVIRRSKFDLRQAEERFHILQGLKIALDHIDQIIALIKKSETREQAEKKLGEKYELTKLQANAILEMRLSSLAALERKKIEDELKEKKKLIEKFKAILADPKKILEIIKKGLNEIKEKFGDNRLTEIHPEELGEFRAEDLIPNEEVIVTLTRDNYIKRLPVNTYRHQGRGGKGVVGMTTKEKDVMAHLLVTRNLEEIMFFTDRGRVFTTKVYEIPQGSRQAKGQALVNVLQISPEEKVTAVITLDPKEKDSQKYFFMATKKGLVKKTEIEAYRNIRKTGIIALKLKGDDALRFIRTTTGDDKIILVSRKAQAIYFQEDQVRPMGRSAAGVRGIKLRKEDELVACDIIRSENATLLTVLENGFGKRTLINKFFSLQNRGGIGVRASKTSVKTGVLVSAQIVETKVGDVLISSQEGQIIRIPLKSVKKLSRDTQGVTLVRFKGHRVASVTLVEDKEK